MAVLAAGGRDGISMMAFLHVRKWYLAVRAFPGLRDRLGRPDRLPGTGIEELHAIGVDREDDALAPEPTTRWLSEHLPNCVGYHVIAGGERFFLYSQANIVNQIIEKFLSVPFNRM